MLRKPSYPWVATSMPQRRKNPSLIVSPPSGIYKAVTGLANYRFSRRRNIIARLKWIIVFTLLIAGYLQSTIFFWDNFEGGSLLPWQALATGNAGVSLEIDPAYSPSDSYCMRRQTHGVYSLWIRDDDPGGIALSVRSLPPLGDNDYLVEFYADIPVGHAPLTWLWLYKPERNGVASDIQIALAPFDQSRFYAVVRDADGLHTLTKPLFGDTLIHPQNWYRFQIYRKRGRGIFLYINGELMGQFSPLSSDPPAYLKIGTSEPQNNGEILFDDFILRTPPDETHPRILLDGQFLDELRDRRSDHDPGTIGVSYAELWDTIISRANYYLHHDTLTFDTLNWIYPFEQMPPSWHGLFSQSYYPQFLQYLSLAYAVEGDTAYASRLKPVLLASGNWLQWDAYINSSITLYGAIGVAHISYNTALAYDLIYDYLDDFSRMSIENGLLVHGIQQLYLGIKEGVLGDRPVNWNMPIVCASGLGLSIPAIEGYQFFLQDEWNEAYNLIRDYLDDPVESFNRQHGDSRENQFYSNYAMVHLSAYAEATRRLFGIDIFPDLRNYGKWRVFSLLPGGYSFLPFGDATQEMDLDEMFLFSRVYQDPVYQWFLRENRNYTFDHNLGFGGDYLFYSGFLWMDRDLTVLDPESARYPLGDIFPVAGWSVLRSGWDEDDVLIGLVSRDNGYRHSHADNNSIVIGYKNRWIIGEVDNPYGFWETEHHNTLLVDDTLGQFFDYSSTSADLGRITAFVAEPEYGYTAARAESSYVTEPGAQPLLSRYTREVVLLKDPRLVLLRDLVKSSSGAHTYSWLFHTYGQLSAVGNRLIFRDGDAGLFSQWISDVSLYSSMETSPIDTGFRYLKVRTVQPSDSAELLVLFYPEEDGQEAFELSERENYWMVNSDLYTLFLRRYSTYLDTGTVPLGPHSGEGKKMLLVGANPFLDYLVYWTEASTGIIHTYSVSPTEEGTAFYEFPGGIPSDEGHFIAPELMTDSAATAYSNGPKLLKRGNINYVVYRAGDVIILEKNGGSSETENSWIIGKGYYPCLFPYISGKVGVLWVRKRDRGDELLYSIVNDNGPEGETILYRSPAGEVIFPPAARVRGDRSLSVAFSVENEDHSYWKLLYLVADLQHPEQITLEEVDVAHENNNVGGGPTPVSMAFDERGGPHLAYMKPFGTKGRSIFHVSRGDDSWETPVSISPPGSRDPSLSVSGDTVICVYEREGAIYSTILTNGRWSPPDRLSPEGFRSLTPLISWPLVAWCGIRGEKGNIFYRAWNRGWSGTGRLVESTLKPLYPFFTAEIEGNSIAVKLVFTNSSAGKGKVTLADTLVPWPGFIVPLLIERDSLLSGRIELEGDLIIAGGATLTLSPGTEILAEENASIKVRGKLIACGSRGEKIIFRNETDGRSWKGVHVEGGQILLDNTLIDGGINGLELVNASATIKNTTIRNSLTCGIRAADSKIDMIESEVLKSKTFGLYFEKTSGKVLKTRIRGSREVAVLAIYCDSLQLGDNELSGNGYISKFADRKIRRKTQMGLVAIRSSLRLRRNSFADLQIGVYSAGSKVDLGLPTSPGRNIFERVRTAIIERHTPGGVLDAVGNWWGSSDPSREMFVGNVNYIPFLRERPSRY